MKNQDRKFKTIDPKISSLKETHNALLGGIAPRPIALVSTISEAGLNNLAPFSFFNAFGANPPYVAFSPSIRGRDGTTKDTLNNLKKIKECVIQAVPFEMVEQVNLASTEYASDIDEFVKSGFTPLDSDLVKPKRVKESPFHMECLVEQIIALGGSNGSGNLVLCRVVKFHVDEKVYKEGIIEPNLIDLVGRNSASFYTRASGDAIFEVSKPSSLGIGIDQLPEHILKSEVLSANNLAQLGGVKMLPDESSLLNFISSIKMKEISPEQIEVLRLGDNYREIFETGYILADRNKNKGIELIEIAAKKALSKNEVDFALLALLSITEI